MSRVWYHAPAAEEGGAREGQELEEMDELGGG